MFAIKAEVDDPGAAAFAFGAQKAMYGGRRIAGGDRIFVFASENEGGPGLVASGIVSAAEATPKKPGIARQTPRVSITIGRTARAKRRLGGSERHPGAPSLDEIDRIAARSVLHELGPFLERREP